MTVLPTPKRPNSRNTTSSMWSSFRPTRRYPARQSRLHLQDEPEKFRAVAKEIKELYAIQKPVLVGTISIAKSRS